MSRKTKKRESLCPKFRVFFDTRKCALKVIHIMLCVNIRVRLSILTQKMSRLLKTLSLILVSLHVTERENVFSCTNVPAIQRSYFVKFRTEGARNRGKRSCIGKGWQTYILGFQIGNLPFKESVYHVELYPYI